MPILVSMARFAARSLGLPAKTRRKLLRSANKRDPHYFRHTGWATPPEILAPTPEEWDRLNPGGGITAPGPQVDVVIPVYKGFADTMRCLFSVLAERQETPFRVIIINDCSPDPALVEALRDLADRFGKRGWIELIENRENLGFVRSCNLGLVRNRDRDVILLNADTEVYGNWLDRLRARAGEEENVAAVNPLSDNPGPYSYPVRGGNNKYIGALEVDGHELARMAAETLSEDAAIDLPDLCGFCLYMPRHGIEAVGLLDPAFGQGGGDDIDFAWRAIKAGWRCVLAPDAYVRHRRHVSFGADKIRARDAAGKKVLMARHPDHDRCMEQSAQFVRADPVLPLRRKLDEARLVRDMKKDRGKSPKKNTVLIAARGGAEPPVVRLRQRLEAEGVRVLLCQSYPEEDGRVQILNPSIAPNPNLVFNPDREGEELTALLRRLDVRHVYTHGALAPGVAEIFRNFQSERVQRC